MKIAFFLIISIIFGFNLGCARVRVEAPKDPIKVDISMRLDIYQHVENDISAIEDIVSGSKEKSKSGNNTSFLSLVLGSAYAQESLGPEVEQAALRRRDRVPALNNLQEKGVIGENKLGLLEIRLSQQTDTKVTILIKEENSDRMIIYGSIAAKNGTSIEEVQKLYAKRLQKDAPIGTPVEILNESKGSYVWEIKK